MGFLLSPIVLCGDNSAMLHDITPLEPRRLFASFGLDPSFGAQGRITTDIAAGSLILRDAHSVSGGAALVLFGPSAVISGPATSGLIARIDEFGQLDSSLDGDGILPLNNSPKRLLAENASDGKFVTVNFDNHTLRQFNANGSLDTGFSGDGFLALDFNGQPWTVERAAYAANGDLLVVGTAIDSGDNLAWLMLRLKPDGTPRTTFGNSGLVRLGTSSVVIDSTVNMQSISRDTFTAQQITETPGGAIFVSGTRVQTVYDEGDLVFSQTDVLAVRVLAEGIVDRRTLDNDGITRMRRQGSTGSAVMIARPLGERRIQLVSSIAGHVVSDIVKPDGKASHVASDYVSFIADQDAFFRDDQSIVIWTTTGTTIESMHLRTNMTIDTDWGVDGISSVETSLGEAVRDGEDLLHFGYAGANQLVASRIDGTPARDATTAGSAVITSDRTLVVRGTDGDDVIQVRARKGAPAIVMINGQVVRTIAEGVLAFDALLVDGGGGNDRIDISQAFITLPPTVLGGAGDDTIFGSPRADAIFGDDGNDVISAGLGDDRLHGGNGDDRIDANEGDDRIDGDAGRDRLNCGAGDDIADGGVGNDRIGGGPGSDNLFGGPGHDLVDGGDDTDYLYGDNSAGNLARDTIIGGAGFDYRSPEETEGDVVDGVEAFISD